MSVYERISDRQRFEKCVVSFNCLFIDREFAAPFEISDGVVCFWGGGGQGDCNLLAVLHNEEVPRRRLYLLDKRKKALLGTNVFGFDRFSLPQNEFAGKALLNALCTVRRKHECAIVAFEYLPFGW